MRELFLFLTFCFPAAAAPFHYDAIVARGDNTYTGPLSITLKLEDNGGTDLFTDTRTVDVQDGHVSVDFGDTMTQQTATTLVVTVAGDTFELPIDAAPAAVQVDSVPVADTLRGFAASEAVSTADLSTVSARSPTWASVVGLSVPVSAGTLGLQDVTGFDSTWRDGTDADTRFSAGAGLTLTNGTFAIGTLATEQIASGAVTEAAISGVISNDKIGAGAVAAASLQAATLSKEGFSRIKMYRKPESGCDENLTLGRTYTLTPCKFVPPGLFLAGQPLPCPDDYANVSVPSAGQFLFVFECQQRPDGFLMAPP
jgi:hypothetical protein